MSMKRRKRRLLSGNPEIDTSGELPLRIWPGLLKNELSLKLKPEEGWPKLGGEEEPPADGGDDVEAQAPLLDPEDRTLEVNSVRSDVHKRLFERRNAKYERYAEEFSAQVAKYGGELKLNETKESMGRRNWNFMVKQLTKENEEEEEAPPKEEDQGE